MLDAANFDAPPLRLTPTEILAVVARRHDLSVSAMLKRRRTREIAWARQEAMLALHRAGHSLNYIGRLLRGEGQPYDHTTILHGIRRAREREGQTCKF